MEKVVYLLGAGFSQPLGLPVMRDFLFRSKDLYFRDPEKYDHFKYILNTIRGMHSAKSYYDVDLLNIEEILSILEMADMVKGGRNRAKRFSRYISDVIESLTPDMPGPSFPMLANGKRHLTTDFRRHLFGAQRRKGYGEFVANLLNLRFDVTLRPGEDQEYVVYARIESPRTHYSVVTLNYDKIITKCMEHVATCFTAARGHEDSASALEIAALHGTVDTNIVAPTWNKWAIRSVKDAWKRAYELLRDANAIRILGYSLPTADTYVRYLLEAAVIESQNLKEIDAICLDDGQQTMKKHYASFVTCKFFRFKNANISDYLCPVYAGTDQDRLSTLRRENISGGEQLSAEFAQLEKHHEDFMSRH